ncbi:unnamed protein product [Clonostachys rosea]|uniref:Glutaredoxin domain-containing protein n=1 Tax=Bionectria ochroleuca TaxID=29856 RepID=A0ABY6TUT7_BIOOC|nr:unnamed protein product [Clonostachys rosea]
MPSPRRIRLVGLAALVLTIFFLYYTSKIEGGSARDRRGAASFYDKTVNAMENKEEDTGQTVIDTKTGSKAGHIPADKDGDGDVDADDRESSLKMQERLKAAEQKAKEKANNKAPLRPDPPRDVVGVGSSAEGQDKKALSGDDDEEPGSKKKKTTSKPTKEEEAEAELNSILKKGPVIIFSKSYCPFSKRAKGLLLEKYSITPTPYVVELDDHQLGPELQDALETLTGRRTVPNIMINGKSIGGADDIVALDSKDQLISKIVTLGSNRVTMTERFTAGE